MYVSLFPVVNQHTQKGILWPIGELCAEGLIGDGGANALQAARIGNPNTVADAFPVRFQ